MYGGGERYSFRSLYERVWHLYVQGLSAREIAARVYGDDSDRAVSRVYRLLHYARRRLDAPYIAEVGEAYRRLEEEGAVAAKKRSRSLYQRQWLEHQTLMYHILHRLGYRQNHPIIAEMNWIHSKLFGIAWRELGDKLRVWRNGRTKSKPPFSFTWHSLAYVYAVLSALFIRKGLYHKRGELDAVIKLLIPAAKQRRIHEFHRAYIDVSSRLYPFLFPATLGAP